MKTTIKNKESTGTKFQLNDLENGDEIGAIIKETEDNLLPCAHCGGNAQTIMYSFFNPAVRGARLKEKGSDEIVQTVNPHKVFVMCGGLLPDRTYCYMRTASLYAEDTEQDLKEALRIISNTWNSRATV